MGEDKPTNEKYKKWLKDNHNLEINNAIKNNYESVTMKMKDQFENSILWNRLNNDFDKLDQEYYVKTKGYYLFMDKNLPNISIKPFDSFLLKTYRKNIRDNKNWPSEPASGWILPENWYSNINDIIRTAFVVKYLDGVDFLIRMLESYCEQCSLPHQVHLEARADGYYAAHLYTRSKFEIPNINWDTEQIEATIEVQVTTQLQDVIRRLLHKYYEDNRIKIKRNENWQWNYESDEFAANYLGHILHYVEGMIMEIRDKEKGE
jgi:hypothetical protein